MGSPGIIDVSNLQHTSIKDRPLALLSQRKNAIG
jgi:hypothetical protein